MRQSQGKYNPEKIQTEIARSKELVTTRDGRLTTTEAIDREQKIIQLALSGKDSQIPLSSLERAEAVSKSLSLNTGQTTALKQMVTSRDGVILIQGNAGVGKTYTMKAFAETVRDEQPKRGLAPSAAAASVLQTESGIPSQTLASYLLTPKEQLPQQEVILVDEASMISTRSAQQLLEKARELKSRVILIGDTKQLSAIETGAPFKLLQTAGLLTAVIDQNLRQRDPSLKQIVNFLATHDKNPDRVNEAYQKLNESGKIKQIEEDETRIKAICSDYLGRPVAVRHKTLILASTNKDKQAIASSVRRGLIDEGTLGDNNLSIQTLKRKNIDKFALTQAHHYQRGDIIKFQTDSAKFSKDFYYRVTSLDPQAQTATLIDTVGITETLELNKYKQREVYQLQELEIRTGERMRFTKNIRSADYKQLNGQRFTIENVTESGRITISSNGKTENVALERLLHSDYSYVDTVHSSQGQTADYCIYSAANAKSKTIGRESFYVAASRAKQEFVVYTKNAQDLGVTIQLSRTQENAHELVQSASKLKNKENNQEHLQRQQTKETAQKTTKTKSEPQNQLSQLNDTELVNLLTRLSQWQKDNPNKPSWNYGQSLHQKIEQLKKEKTQLGKRLRLQELELKRLGKPRSLFNPFGVSADVIEDKQIEISRTRSRIYDTESQLGYVLPDFQRWQKKARAYLAWDESKETKQMRQLEKDFSFLQIQQRVKRLNDIHAVYAAASYIVAQQGTESENGRYYQGRSYRIEQQGKKISITQSEREELLMQATDCRDQGGIIEVNQFNLTCSDKNIIRNFARDLERQIKELQKSRQIQRGGLSR